MKLGRNDPCPCGSGKKYKNCCLRELAAHPQADIGYLDALFMNGRFAELESEARVMLGHHPRNGLVWKMFALSLQMQGKEALTALQKAAELLPRDSEAHANLAGAYRSLGMLEDAEKSCQRALKIRPDFAEAHNNLGVVYKDLGATAEAVASFQRAIKLKPDFAEAHNNLGSALKSQGKLEESISSFRHAMNFKPSFAEAYNNMGTALKELGRIDEAAANYRRAIELKPGFAQAYSNLGNVLQDLGQFDEVAGCYRKALEIDPFSQEAMLGLGYLSLEKGNMNDAKEAFEKIVAVDSNNLDARYMLTQVKKVEFGDENMAALVAIEKKVKKNAPISKHQEISLHFALGKCFDDLGEYDQAFAHFIEGNRLKRSTFDYNDGQMTRFFDSVIRVFSLETIERLRGGGNPSGVPIFVLGMPRSGTTLAEQIIASHPEVYGAGELHDMLMIAGRDVSGTHGFPDNILALDRFILDKWGDDYVSGLLEHSPHSRGITDKMPNNFLVIGLIHVMLPNAKIIHVNRNPVDTCLSCFTKLFSGTLNHTYNLEELGRYYVDYVRLMEHWRKVLPTGAFLEVQYEDIVANLETEARRMIDYCGLEWNDACIDFHKSNRLVRSSSYAQVRQPIYNSSVDRWKRYGEQLAPLLEALGGLAPNR